MKRRQNMKEAYEMWERELTELLLDNLHLKKMCEKLVNKSDSAAEKVHSSMKKLEQDGSTD
jgi:hypothetical protein